MFDRVEGIQTFSYVIKSIGVNTPGFTYGIGVIFISTLDRGGSAT